MADFEENLNTYSERPASKVIANLLNLDLPKYGIPEDRVIAARKYYCEGFTYDEIAYEEKLTKERIRQMIQLALDETISKAEESFEMIELYKEEIQKLKGMNSAWEREYKKLNPDTEKVEAVIKEITSNPSKKLLSVDVDKMGFRIRTRKGLKKMKIKTVGDLTKHYRDDFLEVKNFGAKSLYELDRFMQSNGLEFKTDIQK